MRRLVVRTIMAASFCGAPVAMPLAGGGRRPDSAASAAGSRAPDCGGAGAPPVLGNAAASAASCRGQQRVSKSSASCKYGMSYGLIFLPAE